jgi:hypothetical protein
MQEACGIQPLPIFGFPRLFAKTNGCCARPHRRPFDKKHEPTGSNREDQTDRIKPTAKPPTVRRDMESLRLVGASGQSDAAQEELCEACQKIDLAAAMRGAYYYDKSDAKEGLWSLGPLPYAQLAGSGTRCTLCRFFAGFFEEFGDEAVQGNFDPIMIMLHNDDTGYSPWSSAFETLTFGTDYARPSFRLYVRYRGHMVLTHLGPADRIQLCRDPGSDRPPFGFRIPTPGVPYDLIPELA